MQLTKLRALIGLAALVWAAPAPAAVVENFHLGGWIGNAYVDDASGRFDSCVASASYRSGITLHIEVSAAYNWAIGFSAPHWDMKIGSDIPLQYRIDRGQWQSGTARATAKNLARMEMPQDGYLITRFRRGRTLYVYDGANQFNFRLTGTSRLMARLAQCVKRHTARFGAAPGTGTAAAPPSGGLGSSAPATPAAPAATAVDPQLAVEATQALFNLMGSAGISGLKLVPEGQRSEDLKGVHAVAADDTRTLVAHIFPEGSYKSEQELMSLIVADSQKNCDDGSFSSGTERATEGGKQLYTSYARCTIGDDELIERVAILKRNAGGVFVYGVSDNYSVGGSGTETGPPELTDPDFYAAAADAAD